MTKFDHIDQLLHPEEKAIIDVLFREQSISGIESLNIAELEKLQLYSRKNGLTPLLFSILQENDSPLADRFKTDYLSSLLRNESILCVADKTTKILSEAGIKIMWLKGVYLSRYLYTDCALRPMSDIDILIEDTAAEKAYEILMKNDGFNCNHHENIDDTYHHLPPLVYKNVTIEIHRTLLPSNARFTIPNNDLWSNAQKGDGLQWVMNPNQLFIYLTLHIYYTAMRGGLRMSWFYDLSLLAHSDQLQINSTEIEHWITKWKAEKPFKHIISILCWLDKNNIPAWLKAYQSEHYNIEIKRSIIYFRESNQQQNSFSYTLIWERLSQTKGFGSKINFIWSRIKHDPLNSQTKVTFFYLLKRIVLIVIRTASMLINKLLQIFRINEH